MNSDFLSPAVYIRGAEKRYGNKSSVKPVITGLHMNVPRNNIYALLGPSGCGKTTLLRCILGRLKLDKGSILVLGHVPGSKESGIPGPTVGYMSQATAVYLTMTIGEYLWYFGTIFGLTSEQVVSKTDYLIKSFNLPPKNTLTRSLSGGELRRVQFAGTVIHDPKLLVLDEPTVGIDVISKSSMWQHLVKLTKENGSTIILTTHYIEEARLADRVGMIHNCTMAAEDKTENLLSKYGETTLENVFLKICCGESIEVIVENGVRSDVENELLVNDSDRAKIVHTTPALESCKNSDFSENSPKQSSTRRCNFGISWHRLLPIIMRNCLVFYRFPGAMILITLLPCTLMFLYRETMGNPVGGIPLIIVNDDFGSLGAQYLSYLNPDIIIQKPYRDYGDGFKATWEGKSYGILRIKSNFSSIFYQRFSDYAIATNETINAGNIELRMDNTNLQIINSAKFHVLKVYQDFLRDTLRTAGMNPLIVQSPINITLETMKELTRPLSVFILSGEALLNIYLPAFALSLIGIHIERVQGCMELNIIAGVTSLEIILGVMISQVFVVAIQNIGVVLILLQFLNEYCRGSTFLLSTLMYLQGISGSALGILVSICFDEYIIKYYLTAFLIFFSSIVAGTLWPLEAMHLYFRFICQCLPFALPTWAMKVIIHRGWDISYFAVYGAFGVTFIWTFIFLALSVWIFSRKT